MDEVANPDVPEPQYDPVTGEKLHPDAPAPAGTPAPEPTRPVAPENVAKQGEEVKNDTPFTDPHLQPCPKCDVGVLYVIGWDTKALHEAGQPIYAPNMLSGGVVKVTCFNCGHGETFPMNPVLAPVNPQSGA